MKWLERLPVALSTSLTLVAFAANSILCRLALGGRTIDPVSFTTIRIVSGALMLLVIRRLQTSEPAPPTSTWGSAIWLFIYALPFSLAYLDLSAGTGALILFGGVQITMIGAATLSGAAPNIWQASGIAAAIGGLAYLVWPGLAAPSPAGAMLMTMAGLAWGVYSLRGRGAREPLAMTTGNFQRAAPLALLASAVLFTRADLHPRGVLLALSSGAVTSGLGYVVWYSALRRLTAVRAAVVQLMVPILAAIGGVLFLGETVTARLGVAALLVLGGVGLALFGSPRTA